MLTTSLSIFFDAPFWIGLYERSEDGRYEVCKITFGAEPKEYEVYDFLLHHWGRLRFSPAVSDAPQSQQRKNPKRMQREIQKHLANPGIGTKAQQALQLQREQSKQIRKVTSREHREAEKERQYQLRQEKKKAKRKGR